jgi:hypothetical protein
LRPFAIEQCLLSFDAPSVSGQRSIVPNHSMTGDRNRKVVGCAGSGNSPHRLWRSDSLRDFRVRDRLAYWDFLQRLPYAALEGSAANVERQVEPYAGRFDKADNPRNQRFIFFVSAD